jgi:hypothetical protein
MRPTHPESERVSVKESACPMQIKCLTLENDLGEGIEVER